MWQITGHVRAVQMLQHGLETGRPAHAYLITGQEHIGKMKLALTLAQALNCTGDDPPCGACTACTKIASGGHADVRVIGLAADEEKEKKSISTEQVQDMQHDANLPPFEGRHKVFIIDNAELLSLNAANRLLKTLEEPVRNVTFIILTVNEKLLPATVVSRCQRLELMPVKTEDITAALTARDVPQEKADLLARLSHGCPGWAFTAIEDESLLTARNEEMERLLEIIRGDTVTRFTWAAQAASRFAQNRKAVYGLLDTWRDYWHDLMLVKLGCHVMITNIDRREEIAGLAEGYDLDAIRRTIAGIEAAADHMRRNVNPRLALEVLMIDIPPVKEAAGLQQSAARP